MTSRVPIPGLVLLAFLLAAAGSFFALQAGAADKNEVSVSQTKTMDSWSGGPYTPGVLNRAACTGDALCDSISLKVDGIDDAYWDSHKGGVEVQVVPEKDTDSDFDLYVTDKDGTVVAEGTAAGSSTERAFIPNATAAAGPYKVTIMPYLGAMDAKYKGGVRLESRADASADDVPTTPVSDKPCVNGNAAGFPCKGIDLDGFLPLSSLDPDGSGTTNLNDIWGWTDPQTGKEYALVGKTDGTTFVDVSDPKAPKVLGELPSHQNVAGTPVETIFNTWRDIKVYKDHAFIVSEEPTHGMQVFDLKQLRGITAPRTTPFAETAHYSFIADGPLSLLDPPDPNRGGTFTADNAHNIAINEESGVAYAIGTSTCAGGGSHRIDIKNPADPKFLGCDSTDSYTHDNQCVTYRGPDTEHAGEEICFNSNEDTLTVTKVAEADGTPLATPKILSKETYDEAQYTHQGWLTADSKRFLVNDELDEQEGGQTRTQTYIWNVEDLDKARLQAKHPGETPSIDHNQYVKGERVFQSHYRSGVRILDTSQATSGLLTEKGFFDVYPEDDAAEFNGTWSNYPYFRSGSVIATGIEQGLFVLRPTGDVGAPGNATSAGNVGGAGAGGGQGVTSASGTPSRGKAARRLRAGFGRHLYGKVRKGRFPVQCRQSTTTRRTCRVVASYRGRSIGSGKRVIRRSGIVSVKLNRYGRAVLRKRPKGSPISLQARVRDGSGLVVGAKRARLR